MTYATQQELIDRFGEQELIELTDRATPPAGAIDATVAGKALDDADATINSYVSLRYTLPLSAVPTNIVRIAADIARYYLYENRATEEVKARHDAAIAYLKDVAAGRAKLGVDAQSEQATQAGGTAHRANDRRFTQGSPSQGESGTLDDY